MKHFCTFSINVLTYVRQVVFCMKLSFPACTVNQFQANASFLQLIEIAENYHTCSYEITGFGTSPYKVISVQSQLFMSQSWHKIICFRSLKSIFLTRMWVLSTKEKDYHLINFGIAIIDIILPKKRSKSASSCGTFNWRYISSISASILII